MNGLAKFIRSERFGPISFRIPQRPDYKPGSESGKVIAVEAFRCSERHGVVWVALEEPLRDIPELPEYDDPAYRRVFEFYEPWQAPGLRIMENSFDNAHFAFVHKASFGIVDEPEPVQPRLEPDPAHPSFIHTAHGDGYYLSTTGHRVAER